MEVRPEVMLLRRRIITFIFTNYQLQTLNLSTPKYKNKNLSPQLHVERDRERWEHEFNRFRYSYSNLSLLLHRDEHNKAILQIGRKSALLSLSLSLHDFLFKSGGIFASLSLSLSSRPIMPTSLFSLSILWSNIDSSPLIYRSSSSNGLGLILLISTIWVYQSTPTLLVVFTDPGQWI